MVSDRSRELVMPGSKARTGPGWKDGTHRRPPESELVKNNVDARATKVGIMKSSPQEDQGSSQEVG